MIDANVHEELRSVSELVPYLAEPWKNRVAVADGWHGINRFSYSYPQISGRLFGLTGRLTGRDNPSVE